MALTPRGKALRWMTAHRGITEQPPGSNSDHRKDGIRRAQLDLGRYLVGLPWCGTWCAAALRHAGVRGVTPRLASVSAIEQDAKAKRGPFRGWVTTGDRRWAEKVLRGDLAVLFGPGIHVVMVRSTAWHWRKLGLIRTSEGNTSSGDGGSQDNGGGAFTRLRRIRDVHGFALVNYPNK